MSAHALLARGHEVGCIKPSMQGDFGAFKDSPDSYGKRLAAFFALIQSGAVGFASHFVDAALSRVSAMRASRAFRPALRLKMFAGFVFVGENIGERHGLDLY